MTHDTIWHDFDSKRRILRIAQRSPANPMEARAMKPAASLTRFAPVVSRFSGTHSMTLAPIAPRGSTTSSMERRKRAFCLVWSLGFVTQRTEVRPMRHLGSLFRRIALLPGALVIGLALVLVALHNPGSELNIVTAQRPSRIVFHSNRDGNFEIYAMNADGTGLTRLTNHPGNDTHAALSPDGSRIAFASRRDGNSEIYVMNADGTGVTRLTNHSADDVEPAFSSDGSRIAFASNRDGNYEIYVMSVDGTNVTRLSNNPASDRSPSFSPDGTKIVFESARDGSVDEIYMMGADGTGVTRLTNHPAADLAPRYSPDGRKIAFMSLRHAPPFVPGGPLPSLYFQVYLMSADGTGVTRLTNTTVSEGIPVFSPDGLKIMFTSETGRTSAEIFLMNVDGTSRTRLTNFSAETNGDDWR